MPYEQAALPVQDEAAFAKARTFIDAAFAPGSVEKFLSAVKRSGARVREFETLLGKGAFASFSAEAQTVYAGLAVSDQAQVREHYLTRVEEVAPELRAKFRELYRYQ